MDQILALQYRRHTRRLQMIVLPYSFNVSAAALIRFSAVRNPPPATEGWRIVGITGMEFTLKDEDLPDFIADASMKDVFESSWLRPEGLYREAAAVVNTEAWDFSDLVAHRVPRQLLTLIPEQVDNWA